MGRGLFEGWHVVVLVAGRRPALRLEAAARRGPQPGPLDAHLQVRGGRDEERRQGRPSPAPPAPTPCAARRCRSRRPVRPTHRRHRRRATRASRLPPRTRPRPPRSRSSGPWPEDGAPTALRPPRWPFCAGDPTPRGGCRSVTTCASCAAASSRDRRDRPRWRRRLDLLRLAADDAVRAAAGAEPPARRAAWCSSTSPVSPRPSRSSSRSRSSSASSSPARCGSTRCGRSSSRA